MDKVITTYDQLLREKKKLQALQNEQKERISNRWAQLKMEFVPARIAFRILRKLVQNKRESSLAVKSANLTIDLLVARLFRSNYMLRLFFAALLKNLSSHYADKVATGLRRAIKQHP